MQGRPPRLSSFSPPRSGRRIVASTRHSSRPTVGPAPSGSSPCPRFRRHRPPMKSLQKNLSTVRPGRSARRSSRRARRPGGSLNPAPPEVPLFEKQSVARGAACDDRLHPRRSKHRADLAARVTSTTSHLWFESPPEAGPASKTAATRHEPRRQHRTIWPPAHLTLKLCCGADACEAPPALANLQAGHVSVHGAGERGRRLPSLPVSSSGC